MSLTPASLVSAQSRFRSRVVCLLAAVATACGLELEAVAQESWEFSPYQVQVWVNLASPAGLTPGYRRTLFRTIQQRAENEMAAVWDLAVAAPLPPIAAAMSVELELVTPELIQEVAPAALAADKLILLAVLENARGFEVRARELDCRTRTLGPVIERQVRQLCQLDKECFTAVRAAFAALVRIEQGGGRQLTVRLRAGGLITDPASPAHIDVGDILQPVLRRNDRLGQPIRINVVPWTYLQVEGRAEINPNLLRVYVHSSWRSPIRGGTSARREQYALAIRPTQTSTLLEIEAKPLRRGDSPYPLEGLEIYARRPTTAAAPRTKAEQLAAEQRNPPELLGLTDWRGALMIPRGEQPLRLLYVKNGGQLLARLPIVPGVGARQTVQVPDDDPRLQAEGFIKGFNGELMDLVAQRQMFAARIRKRIAEGETEEATRLLEQFRGLPTRNDMIRQLEQQQTRQTVSPNPTVQKRIQRLYSDTRKTLSKYLDPDLEGVLLKEVNAESERGGT